MADFMTTDYADKLDGDCLFRPLPGGSPANLCMNMARLNNKAVLVATLGKDGIGEFLFDYVNQLNIDCRYIRTVDHPSTLILVTQSLNLPSFEVYRSADRFIEKEQLPDDLLDNINIFHTTCFALSERPARESILAAAQRAVQSGCQLSIDLNYAKKIWPDESEAQTIVGAYCSMGAIVKASDIDWERLYGQSFDQPELAVKHFLSLGASEVCITLGEKGSCVGNAQSIEHVPARRVEVKDTTGAGDAFWSGYLTAWLDGHEKENCARAGRHMAGMKISTSGPLPSMIDRDELYTEFVG